MVKYVPDNALSRRSLSYAPVRAGVWASCKQWVGGALRCGNRRSGSAAHTAYPVNGVDAVAQERRIQRLELEYAALQEQVAALAAQLKSRDVQVVPTAIVPPPPAVAAPAPGGAGVDAAEPPMPRMTLFKPTDLLGARNKLRAGGGAEQGSTDAHPAAATLAVGSSDAAAGCATRSTSTTRTRAGPAPAAVGKLGAAQLPAAPVAAPRPSVMISKDMLTSVRLRSAPPAAAATTAAPASLPEPSLSVAQEAGSAQPTLPALRQGGSMVADLRARLKQRADAAAAGQAASAAAHPAVTSSTEPTPDIDGVTAKPRTSLRGGAADARPQCLPAAALPTAATALLVPTAASWNLAQQRARCTSGEVVHALSEVGDVAPPTTLPSVLPSVLPLAPRTLVEVADRPAEAPAEVLTETPAAAALQRAHLTIPDAFIAASAAARESIRARAQAVVMESFANAARAAAAAAGGVPGDSAASMRSPPAHSSSSSGSGRKRARTPLTSLSLTHAASPSAAKSRTRSTTIDAEAKDAQPVDAQPPVQQPCGDENAEAAQEGSNPPAHDAAHLLGALARKAGAGKGASQVAAKPASAAAFAGAARVHARPKGGGSAGGIVVEAPSAAVATLPSFVAQAAAMAARRSERAAAVSVVVEASTMRGCASPVPVPATVMATGAPFTSPRGRRTTPHALTSPSSVTPLRMRAGGMHSTVAFGRTTSVANVDLVPTVQ